MDKRGISPIFATVLLMAFAVAIGAMIMNWSAGLSLGFSCDNAEMEITQTACITGSVVRIGIKNTGSAPISEFLVGSEKKIDGVDVQPKQGINVEADFTENEAQRGLRITPVIKTDKKRLECTSKSYVIEELKACSS